MTVRTVMGLFTDGLALAQKLAVGDAPDAAQVADLGTDARNAFLRAKYAAAACLDDLLPPSRKVLPHRGELGSLAAVAAGPRSVDGSSVGLAYSLALLGWLIDRNVPDNFYITGAIHPGSAAVLTNNAPEATRAKSTVVPPGCTMILPLSDLQVVQPAAGAGVIGVSGLLEAARIVFGDDVETSLREAAEQQATQAWPANKFLDYLAGRFPDGVAYAGGDPIVFLAASLYFTFCSAWHQNYQAPNAWPTLATRVSRPPESLDEYVERMLRSVLSDWPDARQAVDMALAYLHQQDVTELRDPSEIGVDGLPEVLLLQSLRGVQVPRGQQSSAEIISRRIGDAMKNGQSRIFLDFQAAMALFNADLAGRVTMEIFGRRGGFFVTTRPDEENPEQPENEIRSEANIKSGLGFINATLGGAWLTKYALVYLNSVDPQRWPLDLYAPAFDLQPDRYPSDADMSNFIQGISNSVATYGVYGLFLEHSFQPRVFWEMAAGSNRRYGAEKVILRALFRELMAERRPLEGKNVLVDWSYDMMPLVADLRLQLHEVLEDYLVANYYYQDYAFYGRTNLYNAWFGVPEWNEILTAELPPSFLDDMHEYGEEFAWNPSSDAPSGRISVLSGRTSTIKAVVNFRRQLVLNHLMDPATDIEELDLFELMPAHWWSLRPTGSFLDPYLWRRSGSLATDGQHLEAFAQGLVHAPVVWDPYTWEGCGFGTILATQAQFGLAMLSLVACKYGAPADDRAAALHFELNARELVPFALDEFLPSMERAIRLIQRVRECVGHNQAGHSCRNCAELRWAEDRITVTMPLIRALCDRIRAQSTL